MAFDDLEAELALLINQMDTQPENPHELYLRIFEKLNEFKALGLPLPDDLVRVEKELEAYFKEQEQRRQEALAAPALRRLRRRSPHRCRSTSDRRHKAAGSGRPSR